MDWEFGVSRGKLLYLEWISNEALLHSTGKYIQFLGIDHDGRLCEKKNVCVCVCVCERERERERETGSLCSTVEIDRTL